MVGTVNKHIRIDEELWERLETAAKDRETTANRLLAELAAQWLENRGWPQTDVQIQVARSSLFTAQAIARDLIAAGREKEIEEIRNRRARSRDNRPHRRRPGRGRGRHGRAPPSRHATPP